MTGLLLLFVAGIWLVITLFIVKILTKICAKSKWKTLVGVFLFALIFPLPLLDEIVGGQQFAQLCKENSTIQVDRKTAVGRTVYLKDVLDENIKDTWLPIRLERWRFVDAKTDELVLSYNIFHAERTWFRLSESGYPFTFKGYCEPKSRPATIETFKEYGITYIEPPTKSNKTTK